MILLKRASSLLFTTGVRGYSGRTAIPMCLLFKLWLTVLCLANQVLLTSQSSSNNHASQISGETHHASSSQIVKRDLSQLGLSNIDFNPSLATSEDFPIVPGNSLQGSKDTDIQNGDSSREYSTNLDIIDDGMSAIDRAIARIEEDLAYSKGQNNLNDETKSLDESDVSIYKRPAFSAWAGKRAHLKKRPAFNAWSGKRSNTVLNSANDDPSADTYDSDSYPATAKRPSFNSWGGRKRSQSDFSAHKRPSFHSWGGKKRSGTQNNRNRLHKKPAFNAWSGKRAAVNSDYQKYLGGFDTSADIQNDQRFQTLSNFATEDDIADLITDIINLSHELDESGKQISTGLLLPFYATDLDSNNDEDKEIKKRPSFHSWGGRRKRFWDDRIMRSSAPSMGRNNFFLLDPARDVPKIKTIPESTSLLDNLTNLLGNIRYDGTTFGKLLRSYEGRQRVLTELKSLYNRMVNARRTEKDAMTREDEAKIKALEKINAAKATRSARPKAVTYRLQVKRPAFNAWSGKRSVDNSRRKRSAELEIKSTSSTASNPSSEKVYVPSSDALEIESPLLNIADDIAEAPIKDTAIDNPKQAERRVDLSQFGVSPIGKPQFGPKPYDILGLGHEGPRLQSWKDSAKQRDDHASPEKRPAFHSWSGKRDGNENALGKNSVDENMQNSETNSAKTASVKDENNDKIASVEVPSTGEDEEDHVVDQGLLGVAKRSGLGWGEDSDIYVDASDIESDDEMKRGRMGFNSWGGKRSSQDADKRGRLGFHSWGGKRDGSSDAEGVEDVDKRGRMGFHSWGGKRDALNDAFSLDEDKRGRLGFHSWGGKRDGDVMSEDLDKRGRLGFHSWGGKRDGLSDVLEIDEDKRGRMGFHSWGGKREDGLDSELDGTEDKRGRLGFHSWGGKRSDTLDGETVVEDADKRGRLGFHSWGGKRNGLDNDENEKRGRLGFHSWGGKRGVEDALSEDAEKRGRLGFHSWGGKRDGDLNPEEVDKRGRLGFHSWGGKRDGIDGSLEDAFEKRGRLGFHSWGGKRSDDSFDLLHDADKRGRLGFHSWGGKRSDGAFDGLSEADKRGRLGFHSWGGKRDSSLYQSLDGDADKRGRLGFHSWGGKRDGNLDEDIDKRGRLGFHSWGGKRDSILEELSKRGKMGFHAWAGKRDTDDSKRPVFRLWSNENTPIDAHMQGLLQKLDANFMENFDDQQNPGIFVEKPLFDWLPTEEYYFPNEPTAIFSKSEDENPGQIVFPFQELGAEQKDINSVDEYKTLAPADLVSDLTQQLKKRSASTSKSQDFRANPNKRPAFHAWSGKRDSQNTQTALSESNTKPVDNLKNNDNTPSQKSIVKSDDVLNRKEHEDTDNADAH